MQQPPVVRIAPLPVAPKPAEPPSTEANPVKFEAVASPHAGNALARLREANKEASRSVFDGYFTGATVNFRWRPGEVYDVVLARNRTTNLALAPGEGYVNAVFGDDRYSHEGVVSQAVIAISSSYVYPFVRLDAAIPSSR